MSDERTVHQRILAILDEMPAIGKNQRNEQQRFMFRGHDDVMNALNPLLAKHGVFVVPDVLERIRDHRETDKGKTMYETSLHVRYRFYGASGDFVEASVWGEGTDMGDKDTNKAMTMAFKNVLAQTFALATQELSDADSETPEHTTRRSSSAAAAPPAQPTERLTPPSAAQRREFTGLLERLSAFDPNRKWMEDVIEPWVLKQTGGTVADIKSKNGYGLLLDKVNDIVRKLEGQGHTASGFPNEVRDSDLEAAGVVPSGAPAPADEDLPPL